MPVNLEQSAQAPLADDRPVWSWRGATERTAASEYVHLRGADIHYRVWSTGVGSPLLFVHGFRGHSHWWDWIAPSFADAFDVVAIDLSGMGESDWRASYADDCFARDILGLVDHLDRGPATVVGHSFGGGSLLRACALEAEPGSAPKIEHAIVVDTWVHLPGQPDPPVAPPGPGRQYPDFESAKQRFRLAPPQPVADPGMLDHLAVHSLRQVDGTWRWKFDPNMSGSGIRDGRAMLRRIGIPVDIVYGEASAIVDRERAQSCVAELRNGRGPIEIPAGQPHLMLDQPVALIATLRALLATRG
jgi:pimeloyl-ACP methyl ester carboxylesterase